ncbi:Flp family type IVb pilin [Methylocystis sp. JAN1]|uniref:Flp family type IVb pilin n=1 Tax=Methylocystis sp. JAN1 TaxID=3397211 RepID=UPI003FA2505A
MLASARKFMQDETGATAIEYSLMASIIALAIVAGAKAVGTSLSTTFPKVTGNLA